MAPEGNRSFSDPDHWTDRQKLCYARGEFGSADRRIASFVRRRPESSLIDRRTFPNTGFDAGSEGMDNSKGLRGHRDCLRSPDPGPQKGASEVSAIAMSSLRPQGSAMWSTEEAAEAGLSLTRAAVGRFLLLPPSPN